MFDRPEKSRIIQNRNLSEPFVRSTVFGQPNETKKGAQNNALENEAEANANSVISKEGAPTITAIQGSHQIQQKKSEGGKQENIEAQLDSKVGTGQKLATNDQKEMESGFGTDLSNVRVHNDAASHNMSESIGAKAFTTGSDIFFGKGEYNTQSNKGKHLLAHEITHTLQQGKSNKAIQKAETDTATEGSQKIGDSKVEINAYVNSVLKAASKFKTKDERLNYVYLKLADGTGWSAIEDWISANIPDDKKYLPNKSDTKYAGAEKEVSIVDNGKLWGNAGRFFSILNPSLKINGILIGSDKIGHFFQQGHEYYQIAYKNNQGSQKAKEYGQSTEEGGFGLFTTGVYSNADLVANSSGMNFWQDYANNPNMTFDIAKYLSKQWNEEHNPNFYAPKIGKVVWSNLLNGASRGFISYPSLESTPLTAATAETSLVGKKFKSTFKYSVPDKKGVHSLTMTGNLEHIQNEALKKKGNEAVEGVKISFTWTHSNGKSGTGVLINYKEVLLQGKLVLDQNGSKSDYRTIKLYT